jgi:hypothetical protein
MFFTTDINGLWKIRKPKDPKEYIKKVRREIVPQLESMIQNAVAIIKETFDVAPFETMVISKAQSSRLIPNLPEALVLRNPVTCCRYCPCGKFFS